MFGIVKTLLLAFAGVTLASEDASSNVLVLTKDTFESTLKEKSLIMVEFYAPWCGHCKALAPEYEKAADDLVNDNISLAKVDCTVETEVCTEQGVQGYPTIKVFRDGHPSEYNKPRKAEAIVGYLKKQLLPPITDIKPEEFDEFTKKDKVVVVGFFDNEDDPVLQTLKKVANQLRDEFLFGYTTRMDFAHKEKVDTPAIILYKQFDEGKSVFPENLDESLVFQGTDKEITSEQITKFIQVNSVPLMNDIGPENYAKYIDAGLPIAFLFFGDEEQKKAAGKEVEPIAKKYRGKVSFVYCDGKLYGGHAANLNLKETWPALAIQVPDNGLKYPFDQSKEIKESDVDEFVASFVDGKLKPSIKSAPIPEKNDDPVKVVVADEFEKLVLDKSKNVFIEFYAPWCGHCKRLAPIWEELAEKLASVDNIVIAKMDATENDVPAGLGFQIEGFPTLKLFKAETNEVVDYNGDRTVESFVSFLKENVDESIELKEEERDEL